MSELILIDILQHFSFAFTNEAFLFHGFIFCMFTEITFPRFVGLMETGVIAIFMCDGFTGNASMDLEYFFSVLLLLSSVDTFFLGIFGETDLTKGC